MQSVAVKYYCIRRFEKDAFIYEDRFKETNKISYLILQSNEKQTLIKKKYLRIEKTGPKSS